MSPKTWRCQTCSNLVLNDQLLQAPSIMLGCPICKNSKGFLPICDEPDCEKVATRGFQTEIGYRNTCFDHSKFALHAGKQLFPGVKFVMVNSKTQ